ncbi:MAG: hypothetical protein LBS36_11410 [Oscillospiraceae bacterium]|jgi:hypothetical protein|nr:hypothetical protein [Oscillospiraceae bacterium]
MQKPFKIRAAASLLAVCLCVFLAACDRGGETSVPDSAQALSDEEVIERYRQAGYVYGWFEIYNIAFDAESEKLVDGVKYYKVAHEDIHDMASLRACLGEYFAESIVNALLSPSRSPAEFVEADGVLYTNPTVRAADRFAGEESFRVVRSQGGELINLLVDVEKLNGNMEQDGTRGYTFVLKNTGGKWLFENFSMVR